VQACYQHLHLTAGQGWACQRGVEAVMIPPRSSRANNFSGRLLLTVRTKVTDRMQIFGDRL